MSERLDGRNNPSEGVGPKEFGIKTFGRTIPSLKHPSHNEDAIGRSDDHGFALVLDGVGGVQNGLAASNAAARALSESLRNFPDNNLRAARAAIDGALTFADFRVTREGQGGNTTATVVKMVIDDGQRHAVVGHVGDSRAYLFRDGRMTQITDDDTPLGEDPDAKRISKKLDEVATQRDLDRLPSDEAEYFHERHVITACLGQGNIRPHSYDFPVKDGDKIVLTSDGVHDNLTFSEMERILRQGSSDPANALTQNAYARSREGISIRAKKDDISAVVVDVLPVMAKGPTGRYPVVGTRAPEQRQVPDIDLTGGRDVQLDYRPGSTIKVLLPKDLVLEVGHIADLGINDGKWTTEFVIVDPIEFEETNREAGYKGLRDGEVVPLGRLTEAGRRFSFNEEVSRYHVEIRREGSRIIITDLNSSNGTKIRL